MEQARKTLRVFWANHKSISKFSQLVSTREAVLLVAMLYKTWGSPARYPQHIKPRNSQCKAPRLFLKVFKAAKWQNITIDKSNISSNAWAHHSSIRNVSSATSALVAPGIQLNVYSMPPFCCKSFWRDWWWCWFFQLCHSNSSGRNYDNLDFPEFFWVPISLPQIRYVLFVKN